MKNISEDGTPVDILLDSPWLVCFDPLALDFIPTVIEELSAIGSIELSVFLDKMNANFSAMSCYLIPDFQEGWYAIDPKDINKFGDEDDDLDYEEGLENEGESIDPATGFPWVGVDSGTLVFADYSYLPRLVKIFTWEKYDLALQDETVFDQIANALGGSHFAIIHGGCMPGMQFDGDGTYSIKANCVRRVGNV
jgi:hypothetical protein